MKKIFFVLILLLMVVGGLVFANRGTKVETVEKAIPQPLSAAERKTAMEQWETTPEGIHFRNWEASPAGRKVHEAAVNIRPYVRDSSVMEAVVTNLSLPPGSRVGFGMMIRIKGYEYILSFGPEQSGKNQLNFHSEFEQLHGLKVQDTILLRSKFVSKAPKYAYPIVRGDNVEKEGKILYKRKPNQGGC